MQQLPIILIGAGLVGALFAGQPAPHDVPVDVHAVLAAARARRPPLPARLHG